MFNLVSGLGPVVGEALATHPDVDMVSFTGSTRAGKRVAELAAASVKKVALELGGKSPFVILDDADFAAAVATGVDAAYKNSGQTCDALHTHARAEVAARRGRGARARRRRVVHRRRPFAERHAARSADLVGPARSRARLHRHGDRRGRDARHRWRRRRPTASTPATS